MILAVDTGGTKTLVAAYSASGDKQIISKFPTPLDTRDYIEQLTQTILASKVTPLDCMVVAVPGLIDAHSIISICPNLGWRNFDLLSALKQGFPDTQIILENDANLAGLGEVRSQKLTTGTHIYITISTGIGSGIIIDGRIHPAVRRSEAGHMLLEYEGKLQDWEHFASGRAIADSYKKMAHDITDPHDWAAIVTRIEKGFLALIPLLQPDSIIIGGSVGTYYDRYMPLLIDTLKQKLPEVVPIPEFHQAIHPEEAVIYGCYYHGIDTLTP